MKTIAKLAAIVIVTLATSTGVMAASINERQDNQQARIKQGVVSGELTAREATIIFLAARSFLILCAVAK